MRIRPARSEDAAAITRVRLACWHATYTGMLPDTLLSYQFMGEFIGRRQQVLAARGAREIGFVAEDVGQVGDAEYAGDTKNGKHTQVGAECRETAHGLDKRQLHDCFPHHGCGWD